MQGLFAQSIIALSLLISVFAMRPNSAGHDADGESEDLYARAEWDRIRLCDPATGRIPNNIRDKELEFAGSLPRRDIGSHGLSIQSNTWSPTGPYNIGGRTRALALDVTNENTILAGQVSGGIWKSTNAGSSWRRCTAVDKNLPATCLCQDTRAGKQQTWYAGTGELWGNSAELNGSGVYKSTDNGETWSSLKSSYNNTPESWDNAFEFVWRIVVDHTSLSQDIVYAATALGAIHRSSDGGQSWTPVLGTFANGHGYFTEIAMSAKGVLYATISQQSSSSGSSTVKGIYRSTDGIKWTNISPSFMPTLYGRIAIGIAPSDENQVYFLANTQGTGFRQVNFAGKEDWTSLWKYTYTGGDGSGAGGTWDDRSQNLPRFGGAFGDFQTQNSYDIFVRVHPQKPNTVFVGGTNLCRSDDGFTTPTWTWIGGYGPGSSLPFYEVYPNNHPDQHEMAFYASNPDRAICSCDGGIFRSDNVNSGTVQWTSLNNGYQTTQFYTCAVDHKNNNAVMIGGLQDNGTAFTNTLSASKEWSAPGLGDGSYCAIADDGMVYMSRQQGTIGRFELDNNGNVKRLARIDPKGTVRDSFLFITPFCVDPNAAQRMVVPYRHQLYRCSDLSLTPWGSWGTEPTAEAGWDTIPMPRSPKVISAVALSTAPASRLYYGTQDGYLYRIDNYNASTVNRTDITGPAFSRGNIECICVNPHNADSVIVVFSNYNVQSLFFSSDGGSTWAAIGGNLEAAVNGVGNGPSCRWAEFSFVHGKPMIYVGTSVGLYCTALLNGSNTVWLQEGATTIGNSVVTMMDYRESDNFMAIATHGSGMFAGTVSDLPPAPGVPVLDLPLNGKRAILSSQACSWKAAENASMYGIQVSTDPSFSSVFSSSESIKLLTQTIDNLQQGRIDYYWRVRAYGAGGISAYSEVRSFRTAIEPPVLVQPAGGAANQPLSPLLKWTSVSGARSYRVQLSSTLAFGSSLVDTVVSDSSLQLPVLQSAKRYFWHVQSIDDDGPGIYTDVRNFVTTGSSSVPSDASLFALRCDPSPAQNVATLRCTSRVTQSATIELLDMRGRRIRALFHGIMTEGVNEFSKDVSDLDNGIYIVRLIAASGTEQITIAVQR